MLLCRASIWLPSGGRQRKVRQQENITALLTLNFLSFSASLGWTIQQCQTRDHNRYVCSFTSCSSALHGSSALCSNPALRCRGSCFRPFHEEGLVLVLAALGILVMGRVGVSTARPGNSSFIFSLLGDSVAESKTGEAEGRELHYTHALELLEKWVPEKMRVGLVMMCAPGMVGTSTASLTSVTALVCC